VPYVSYFATLCRPDCPDFAAPGVPLLFDEHHLTAAGSALFAETLKRNDELPLAPALAGARMPSGSSR
jgi:hypothetical protein